MRKLVRIFVVALFIGGALAQKQSPTQAKTLQAVSDEFDSWLKSEDLRIQQQYRIPITELPQVSELKARQDARRAKGMVLRLWNAEIEGRIHHVTTPSLNHDQWLNREVLRWYLQNIVDDEKWYWHIQSVTPY